MKKGSWAAVAVAISATLALGCAGSAWAKDFSDVDYQGGWYVSAVEYVSDKGYMTGYDGSSEFGVGKTLTRGELACLLYKRAGEPSSSKAENLTGMRDIDSPSWYTAAANWAAENKVVTGVDTASGKQFQPGEPVTREMMAAILWRLSGSPTRAPPRSRRSTATTPWTHGRCPPCAGPPTRACSRASTPRPARTSRPCAPSSARRPRP